jgi:hypothetical protein
MSFIHWIPRQLICIYRCFLGQSFRSTKDEEKLHVGLNHRVYLPEIVTMTDGKKSYITVGRILKFPKFSIVAIDISYNDYAWYK